MSHDDDHHAPLLEPSARSTAINPSASGRSQASPLITGAEKINTNEFSYAHSEIAQFMFNSHAIICQSSLISLSSRLRVERGQVPPIRRGEWEQEKPGTVQGERLASTLESSPSQGFRCPTFFPMINCSHHIPYILHAYMPPQVQCKLLAACILCFVFMIVEVVGGYLAKR